MERRGLQALIEEAAVTERRICLVIEAFYTSVRDHGQLGPAFTAILGAGDWSDHISKIVQFWMTAFRLNRAYAARDFMPAHLQHHQISAILTPHWLTLFEQTLQQHSNAMEKAAFSGIAGAMMENLAIGFAKRDDQKLIKPAPLSTDCN
jgi:truncated hemoglobin YjbI